MELIATFILLSPIVYLLALPLWLPPIVVVQRGASWLNQPKGNERKRRAVQRLAGSSPMVASLSLGVVTWYCTIGDTPSSTGIIGEGGTLFSNCAGPALPMLLMIVPATVVGAAAWVVAFSSPKPTHT